MLDNSELLERYLNEAERDGRLTYKKELSLAAASSFRIGGVASFAIYPSSADELSSLCALCRGFSIPFLIVGNTSNLLFDDSGYEGAVIFTTEVKQITVNDTTVTAECGVSLTHLAAEAAKAGLSGIEFAYGIPGTVGGAVFMNAGAYGGEISDVVTSVSFYDIDNDEFGEYTLEQCGFAYRQSAFQGKNVVIISMTVKLARKASEDIVTVMDDYMQRRVDKQPLQYPSAGSVFKRYPGYFSGKLIEDAGLKGFTIGGAQVSEKHAGFIVNIGGATASDVLTLVQHIRDVIKARVGIELECEIRFIPNPAH